MNSVFVTGVSAGLGRSMATQFLSAGYIVYGVSRRAPDDLIANGLKFAAVDLTDQEATEQTINQLLADLPWLDLCVLNAGILGPIGDIRDHSVDELRHVLEVNLWANKTILDWLLQSGRTVKQVVAISSGAGIDAKSGFSGYAISKAALNMMVQLYAAENPQTHFTAFSPGPVDTAMQDSICSHPESIRYPAIQSLQARRGTHEMPAADAVAERFARIVHLLPDQVASGAYADIRDWPAD
ncbi:MAG: SDR family NAD(P)-dependent oxidoreductase [Planctomycetales bacterium]|nr:SDR family NAD(P)-dependent oxidoreductase [Planctomycetales bacterium]